MSRRTSPLPPGWRTTRRRILERDRHTCVIPDCGSTATDVDHGDNGPDDHTDANLRALCAWHHNKRTAQQANAARWANTTKRPTEAHPGLR